MLHIKTLSDGSSPAPPSMEGENNGSWPGCFRQGFGILQE